MPQMNQKSINQVIEELDKSRLGSFNFTVTSPDKGPLILIIFKANPTYRMEILSAGVKFSPGKEQMYDSVAVKGLNNQIGYVRRWIGCLMDELKESQLSYQNITKLLADVEKKVLEEESDPAETFTVDEQHDLKERLEELEKCFEELLGREALTQQQVDDLKV